MNLSPSASAETQSPNAVELAMMLLSFVSVIIVLMLLFAKLDPQTHSFFLYLDTGICLVFLTHFFVGITRSADKREFLRHHWIDFVASIPAIEALRVMRLVQILRVIRLLRASRSILVPLLKQRNQTTLVGIAVALGLILALSSTLILIVESGATGANIHNASDAVWWSLVTISTVGYGDFYPVTPAGHVIGAVVILCGVSFFGVISGYMASLFVAPDQEECVEQQNQLIKQDLAQMLQQMESNQQRMLSEIAALKQEINCLKKSNH